MGLYGQEELSSVPETALNLSRGCGNPSGFADLQQGEVVVDFGCGGGIDVILAAQKVGPQGRVVGIDFAEPMIHRAEQAVAEAGLSHDARALSDVRSFQKGSAAFVDGDCLEMAEGIAREI